MSDNSSDTSTEEEEVSKYRKHMDDYHEAIEEARRNTGHNGVCRNLLYRTARVHDSIRENIQLLGKVSYKADYMSDLVEYELREGRIVSIYDTKKQRRRNQIGETMTELAARIGGGEIRRIWRISDELITPEQEEVFEGRARLLEDTLLARLMTISVRTPRSYVETRMKKEWKEARDALCRPETVARGKVRTPFDLHEQIIRKVMIINLDDVKKNEALEEKITKQRVTCPEIYRKKRSKENSNNISNWTNTESDRKARD